MKSYEEIVQSIEEAPMTYLPAILSTVIVECMKKKVFVDFEKMQKFIRNVIMRNRFI